MASMRCTSHEVRKDIISPAGVLSARVYLFCICAWAVLKVLHDVMLLWGQPELVTLWIGFASLVFQGLAVSSGMLAMMGAAQVSKGKRGMEKGTSQMRTTSKTRCVLPRKTHNLRKQTSQMNASEASPFSIPLFALA